MINLNNLIVKELFVLSRNTLCHKTVPKIIIIIIIIIIIPSTFFTPALADGLSLESEEQQVSSSLQDSSWYSVRFKQRCNLDGLHSFSDFYVFEPPYQASGDCSKRTNYNCHHRHLHVPRSRYLSLFILFKIFILWFPGITKSTN